MLGYTVNRGGGDVNLALQIVHIWREKNILSPAAAEQILLTLQSPSSVFESTPDPFAVVYVDASFLFILHPFFFKKKGTEATASTAATTAPVECSDGSWFHAAPTSV